MLTQLRDTLKEQQQCIVGLKAAEVQSLAMRQQALWEHIKGLEEERVRLLSNSFGVKPQDVRTLRLKDLVDVAVPEQTEDLKKLRSGFADIAKEVQELQRFNRALMERSKTFFREALLFLTKGGELYNKIG